MTALAAKLETSNWQLQTFAVVMGSWLIAAGAHISIPIVPVPMTMQSLAVLLIGGTYGLRLAAITTAAYLAQGAVGFPIFAGGAGGAAHLVGPTGGYLVGFIACACIVAWLCENGFAKGWGRLLATLFAGSAVLMACGIIWLAQYTGWDNAISAGLTPFWVGMLAKIALAAVLIRSVDKVLR